MKTTFTLNDQTYHTDLTHPIDISIPLKEGDSNVNAFHAPAVKFEPVRSDEFIGSVKEGGPCDFNNIFFNPHGNGTHTECIGHIAKEKITINETLKQFFFLAKLVSIEPRINEFGDHLIFRDQVEQVLEDSHVEALVIRTMPNDDTKLSRNYSDANPPYFEIDAMFSIKNADIKHLLMDLPSVDKESDGGKMEAHHVYWDHDPQTFSASTNHRMGCTITELIYVPDEVADGLYLLNLQIASFENDASPSKPILYRIEKS